VFASIVEDLPYWQNRVVPDPSTKAGFRFEYHYPEELRERAKLSRDVLTRAWRSRHNTMVLSNENNLNFGHTCGTCRFGDDPKTSVLDAYNRARYLGEAIESALGQTYPNVEVVVVDDGSTDETPRLVEPYLDRIRYVRQDNAGRSAARNRGIEEARGVYVSFLDSDDRWLPDKLEHHVPVLEERAAVGMVHGHVDVIDDAGRPLPERTAFHHRLWTDAHRNGVTYARYALECRCFSSATTFRRDVFDRVGLYDPSLALDDYELYLRFALDSEIVFIERSATEYRWHDENMDSDQLTLGQIQGAEKHLRLLESRTDVPDRAKARRNLHAMLARSYNVLGDQRSARRHALRALRPDPLGVEMLRRIAASVVL
jgi:glycosyltransferase involved in cell wall biosynthesis